jgi:hypothetical protein
MRVIVSIFCMAFSSLALGVNPIWGAETLSFTTIDWPGAESTMAHGINRGEGRAGLLGPSSVDIVGTFPWFFVLWRSTH